MKKYIYCFVLQFRYSDGFDKFLILLSTTAALINGGLVPTQLAFVGKMTNTFINYEKARLNYPNVTASSTEFIDEMSYFSKVFVYMSLGIWFGGYLQCCCCEISAIRQSHRIRLKYQESLMKQEIAWFEEHEASVLNSRIYE